MWAAERYTARFRELDPVVRRRLCAPPRCCTERAADGAVLPAPPSLARRGGETTRHRFRVFRTRNDGNCFYHAVAASSDDESWTHRTVRAAVAHHFRTSGVRNRAEREALQRAETDGAWAHTEEVIAAAHALRRHVLVFEDVLNDWTSFGDETHPPLYLINRSNVHFEGLAP